MARVLRVPMAFVSMAEEDRQVLPGMIGLCEPWSGLRALPLSHSLWRYVVASGEPPVLCDVLADTLVRARLDPAPPGTPGP
ncbi:hypothetical protein ACFXB3_02705 [Streptomyces sp. NPDC059447]|uniref:hypothetical protein n=1 Tax=Streptomyces sp. NPDC059447 TaxID=3346834 RepID=UPI00368A8217